MSTAPEMTLAVNRMKRAQGQLAGVLRMIDEGRDLPDVVNQLKAVSRALERAGLAMVAGEMRCRLGDGGVPESADLDELEKLLLSLA